MATRTAHGRARELGRLTVSECTPADELPPATPALTAPADRTPDGRFRPGNSIARHSRTKAGPQGALLRLDAQADPEWRAARNWARRGATHRVREMAQLHGGQVGSEVCALIVDSWEMRGDARYLAAKARALGDADLSRAAANLLASARQAQRDAWELASREAAARPKQNPTMALLHNIREGE
jgi:hypothetical protein